MVLLKKQQCKGSRIDAHGPGQRRRDRKSLKAEFQILIDMCAEAHTGDKNETGG